MKNRIISSTSYRQHNENTWKDRFLEKCEKISFRWHNFCLIRYIQSLRARYIEIINENRTILNRTLFTDTKITDTNFSKNSDQSVCF